MLQEGVLKKVLERPATRSRGPPVVTAGGFPSTCGRRQQQKEKEKSFSSAGWEDRIMTEAAEANSAAVAAMTPAEVCRELEEARSGLSAKAWAVLEKRAAAKKVTSVSKVKNIPKEDNERPLRAAIEILLVPESRSGRSSATRYAAAALLDAVQNDTLDTNETEDAIKALCTLLTARDKYAQVNLRDAFISLEILSSRPWPETLEENEILWRPVSVLLQNHEVIEDASAKMCAIIINRAPLQRSAAQILLPAVQKHKSRIELVAVVAVSLDKEEAAQLKPLPSDLWLLNFETEKIVTAAAAVGDLELALDAVSDTTKIKESDELGICEALLPYRNTDARVSRVLETLGQRLADRSPSIHSEAMLASLRSGGAPRRLKEQAIEQIVASTMKNKFPSAAASILLSESSEVLKAVEGYGARSLLYDHTVDPSIFIQAAAINPVNMLFALASDTHLANDLKERGQRYAETQGYTVKPGPWAGVLEPLLRGTFAPFLLLHKKDLFLTSIPMGAVFVHIAIFAQQHDHPKAQDILLHCLEEPFLLKAIHCTLTRIEKKTSSSFQRVLKSKGESLLQLAQAVVDAALERGPESLAAFIAALFLRHCFPADVRAIVWRAVGAIGLHRLFEVDESHFDLLACNDPDDAHVLADVVAAALANDRDNQPSFLRSLAIQHLAFFFNLFPHDDFEVNVRTQFIMKHAGHQSESILADIRSSQQQLLCSSN